MLWQRRIIRLIMFLIEITIMGVVIYFSFTSAMPKGSFISFVDGTSMEPTLQDKQMIFAEEAPVTYETIVIFYYGENDETIIIKRVIGMPGDRIQITQEGIYRNGTLIREEYIPEEKKAFTYRKDGYNDVTLGDGEYYVLGDNREVSFDSRSFGVLKESLIISPYSENVTSKTVSTVLFCSGIMIVILVIYNTFAKRFQKGMLKIIFTCMRKNISK